MRVAVLLALVLSGCASSNMNMTYNTPPPDVIGHQTPHTVP